VGKYHSNKNTKIKDLNLNRNIKVLTKLWEDLKEDSLHKLKKNIS